MDCLASMLVFLPTFSRNVTPIHFRCMGIALLRPVTHWPWMQARPDGHLCLHVLHLDDMVKTSPAAGRHFVIAAKRQQHVSLE